MNLKLDINTGDLELTNNALSWVTGIDEIRQDWQSRMMTFKGEWFLDQRIGVPYFQEVLKKQPNTNRLRAIFYEATLSTPGIKEITGFSLVLSTTRVLTIDVDGITEDLETFEFTYTEMVLSQPEVAT